MDEQYERSADMRLLELEREARGVARRLVGSTSYTDPDALVESGKDDDETYAQSGTILVATIDAQPRAALIPGAVITIAVSVSNEGDEPAQGVRMSLPLPVDTVYRPGSLVIDAASAADALAYDFFANGAEIGVVTPGTRRSLTVKLGVEAGVSDILLNPQLSATTGAILGLRAMRLTRAVPSAHNALIERPFYESDDVDQSDDVDAESGPENVEAAARMVSVLQPTEFPLPVEHARPPDAPADSTGTTPLPQPLAPPRVTVKSVRSLPEARSAKTRERNAKRPDAAALPLAAPSIKPPESTAAPVPTVEPLASSAVPSPPVKDSAAISLPPPVLSATPPPQVVQHVATAKPAVPRVEPPPTPKAVTKRVTDLKPKTTQAVKPKLKAKAKTSSPKVATLKAGVATRSAPLPLDKPPERPKLEVVRSVDDQLSIAAKGGPILMVRLDRKRLSTLSGLFAGQSFGMIAHYLVLNALAAKDAFPGDHANGSLAAFVAEQEHLLTRALINARLGKTILAANVSAMLPAFESALTSYADERSIAMPPPGEILLFRAFQASEVAFLERVLSNENSFPFMRAAHLFVGLCANDAAIMRGSERRNLAVALSAYTALATAEISKIFLRAKLSREPELFKATEPAFDDAARTVLAALSRSLA